MHSRASRYLARAGQIALMAAAFAVVPWVEAAGPYSFFLVSPCRVVDTRNAAGPTGGPPLGANTQRDFPIIGYCGIPSGAAAVVMNITVAEPTDFGDLRISPAGQAVPLASTINWVTTDSAVTNGAIIPLAATAAATK